MSFEAILLTLVLVGALIVVRHGLRIRTFSWAQAGAVPRGLFHLRRHRGWQLENGSMGEFWAFGSRLGHGSRR